MPSLTDNVIVPKYDALIWPTLQAVIALGGSASNEELANAVIEREGFSAEQQAVLQGDGPKTQLEYRIDWAKTYLKGMGLLTNSKRAVWSVTERGRGVTLAEIPELHRAYSRAANGRSRKRKGDANATVHMPAEQEGFSASMSDVADVADWQDQLLENLLAMSPAAFERLAQQLLREAGFSSVKVTGQTGDGGIDGLGVYRLSLVSFPIFFQCKRYRGTVGSREVRDFRGAMAGRGDKGLLITTGTFTKDAKTEAQRDGAPPIDLIDGERLCDLLKELQLGVETTTRTVEDVVVRAEFFASLEPKGKN